LPAVQSDRIVRPDSQSRVEFLFRVAIQLSGHEIVTLENGHLITLLLGFTQNFKEFLVTHIAAIHFLIDGERGNQERRP
jgi:hypothetical protein